MCTSLWVRGCHVGPLGRSCFRLNRTGYAARAVCPRSRPHLLACVGASPWGGSAGALRVASVCMRSVLFLFRLLPGSLPSTPDSQPSARGEPTPSFGFQAPPPAPFPLPQSLFATKGSKKLAAKREGTGSWSESAKGGRQAGRLLGTEPRKGSGPGRETRNAPGRTGRGWGQARGSALKREGPRGMEPMPPATAET